DHRDLPSSPTRRSSDLSFDALPLTDPVIGVTTKSLISSATCPDAAGIWIALIASAMQAVRMLSTMTSSLLKSQQRRGVLFRHAGELRVGEAAFPHGRDEVGE